jgi:hypothetical protein
MLPNNEPKTVDVTPKNYFIWGESMSGKTHLATQFPNPILLNTDGNAVKVATPSVDIRDYDQFTQIIAELEKGGHTYESVIIDLIDDVRSMLSMYICKRYKVRNLVDVPYGKATCEFKDLWQRLMTKLSQLPYQIIFISHLIETQEVEKPSLAQRELNVCMGRCDVAIRCRKLGEKHIQVCDRKRQNYIESDLQDDRILKVLSSVQNLIKK